MNFLPVWRLTVPDQGLAKLVPGEDILPGLWTAVFSLCLHVLTRRSLIPLCWSPKPMASFNLITSVKVLSPNTITVKLGLHYMSLSGGGGHSICLPHQPCFMLPLIATLQPHCLQTLKYSNLHPTQRPSH